MNRHHDGDGCDGTDRPLTPEDHAAIAHRMGEMMVALARRNGRAVLHHGCFIGQHYGPAGEWMLALRLAGQVAGLAPAEDCDQDGAPILRKVLGEKDERVLLMATHCMSLFPETRNHTRHEVIQSCADAVPLVERFVRHFKHDRRDDGRAAWEEMYDATNVETPSSRETCLRASACSALLTCWASHYSVVPVDA